MVLAVVGSRTFQNYTWLEECLEAAFRRGEISLIISGGARGADSLAIRFARSHGIPFEVISADWERWGRRAGPIRNSELIRRADAVAAFWDGVSRGTLDSIAKARHSGRALVVFPCVPVPLCPLSAGL